jgi:hypothetical protein
MNPKQKIIAGLILTGVTVIPIIVIANVIKNKIDDNTGGSGGSGGSGGTLSALNPIIDNFQYYKVSVNFDANLFGIIDHSPYSQCLINKSVFLNWIGGFSDGNAVLEKLKDGIDYYAIESLSSVSYKRHYIYSALDNYYYTTEDGF